MKEKYLTVSQVCEETSLSKRTIHKAIKRCEIEAVFRGNKYYVNETSLDMWLAVYSKYSKG